MKKQPPKSYFTGLRGGFLCSLEFYRTAILWKQYQSESNRLDMMPFDTPEFIQLDKKCDQSREDYYKAHELAEKQFDIYRKVMNKCAHVYYFEMQFLEILIDKIAHIAQSIMADAKRMEKEVGT